MEKGANIKIIGVGGAGNNVINRMIEDKIKSVDLIGINTDKQILDLCKVKKKIYIGSSVSKGLGAGAKPEVGERAAEENIDEIKDALKNTDMVFITCGMGGGTGTGASPVIAKVAKKMGILTVGVVTKPFKFEARKRMQNAESGIEKLRENVDTLIVIPNDKLLQIVDKSISLPDALKKADEVLNQCVQGITNLINVPSLINLDFADIRTVMKDKGIAHTGMGVASGENRALEATKRAIESPLLDTTINGATDIVVNITGDVSLLDANEAVSYIESITGENVNIIFGTSYDDKKKDEVAVTIIATGIQEKQVQKQENKIEQVDKPVKPEIPEEIIKELKLKSKLVEIQIPSFVKIERG